MNRAIFSAMVCSCKCAAELYLRNECFFCGKVWICTSHSLSFRLFYKYCGLTIFNSFNFVACEFSVESCRMEIFGVFEDLVICCLIIVCKSLKTRLKKDGVLTVRKRRFFPKKRRVSGAKTSFFDPKDFVFFRKNGIFSPVDFFFAFLKVLFTLKSLRNSEKFTPAHSFHILISTLKAMIYILLTSQYKLVVSYRDFENKIGTSFSRSQPSRNGVFTFYLTDLFQRVFQHKKTIGYIDITD
mgnify:CR=1 FL=1